MPSPANPVGQASWPVPPEPTKPQDGLRTKLGVPPPRAPVFIGVYRRSSAASYSLLLLLPARAAELPYFSVLSDDAGAWPDILASIGLQRQPAGVSHVFVARSGSRGQRRVALARRTRRHPDPGRRIVPGRPVRLPPRRPRPGARAEPHRRPPPHPADDLGEGARITRFRPSRRRPDLRARTLERRAHVRRPEDAARGHPVGGGPSRRARLRALPLPAQRALRSRAGIALPLQPPVGVLRFGLPYARRPGLLRRPLAQGRHRRATSGRLAQFRARCRGRRLPAQADRGLPSRRHPGLRLVRTPARQREVLDGPSRMARADRGRTGCPARLAQAHESHQSRVLPRRQHGRARS